LRTFIRKIHLFVLKQPNPAILIAAVCIIAVFGYIDYKTGFEINLSFFYLIPIAFATWYSGKNSGFFITFLSITTWGLSDLAAGERYTRDTILYWNATIRLALFFFIIWLLEEFKRALNHERLLSHTDYLTGVPNSREFYFQANTELLRAKRFKLPITIAYIDVDSFKQINDQFGHMEGDAILQIIAQTILTSVRNTDTAARLGGDEFAVLFPNTNQNGARYVLKKIQNTLEEKMAHTKSKATLSIGVASFDQSPASVDELLHKADEAMYEVKTKEKNNIKFIQG
jgi:diguanylate cyclase (GGDEF)-like protein